MDDFTPAASAFAALWSPGTFRYTVPVPRAEVLERVRENTRSFDRLRGRQRFGYVSWVQADRVRVWHSTFWRSQPSRGALLFDARLEDAGGGDGTVLVGRLRINTAYIATAAWTAVYVAFALLIHFPPLLVAVLVVASLVQLVMTAVSARRDVGPMIEFVERTLAGIAVPAIN